jgi:hypothetical protein
METGPEVTLKTNPARLAPLPMAAEALVPSKLPHTASAPSELPLEDQLLSWSKSVLLFALVADAAVSQTAWL